MIQHISAVTFAVEGMGRSVEFYEKLGFDVVYGGGDSAFTILRSGDAFLNLVATPGYKGQWWGRVILRIDNADAHYQRLLEAGLDPDMPKNAAWGERFFHIHDPDGHEISLSELLPARGTL